MYKNILVAFDHTHSSQNALETAVDILSLHPAAELTITHVSTEKHSKDTTIYSNAREAAPIMTPGIDKMSTPYMRPSPPNQTSVTAHRLTEELDDALQMAKKSLDARGIESGFYPLTGSPAETIVEYASYNKVDLIIVGCTEKNSFQKWFLGSVSEKIVQEAPCHVLVVK
ncbi:universal stress protein [Jeotgalibacillus sp. S-D1]|uniref:universal stress protein n=1 Tax=Jeotgalibacillus sp. S-D1 TaxID=2552189 RepID=UPI001059D437|nr:universal stress protein [Jeotgalibacillus sp. S-D1]TDL35415.1 universal stress protein [Jeotgalibacillus sp. S-D1]